MIDGRLLRSSSVAVTLLVEACSPSQPPAIHRLEIWAPGLHVTLDNSGTGQFSKGEGRQTGQFQITPGEFARIVERTDALRRSPETINADKVPELMLQGDRCDGPYVTDNGGITLRWTGLKTDQFLLVDYGCDPKRNADRNRQLGTLLASLPVPEPASLP